MKYFAAVLVGFSFFCSAKTLELVSSEQRTQLIELYTSEGCSSCPPADRWLSEYKNHPQLWQSIVPIAFHVDYWDYLGWRDPFASAKHSARQRDYNNHGELSQVYTPGFIVNGREWRRWFSHRGLPDFEPAVAGTLDLFVEDNQFNATFNGKDADTLHIVWLGFNLMSSIESGENRGRRLQHDFVVLSHSSFPGKSGWRGTLPERPSRSEHTALAAWVSSGLNPAPLQAVGGWYPPLAN